MTSSENQRSATVSNNTKNEVKTTDDSSERDRHHMGVLTGEDGSPFALLVGFTSRLASGEREWGFEHEQIDVVVSFEFGNFLVHKVRDDVGDLDVGTLRV